MLNRISTVMYDICEKCQEAAEEEVDSSTGKISSSLFAN